MACAKSGHGVTPIRDGISNSFDDGPSFSGGGGNSGELKADTAHLKGDLKCDIANLKGELKSDTAHLKDQIKSDINSLKGEITEAMDKRFDKIMDEMNRRFDKVDDNTKWRLSGIIIPVCIAVFTSLFTAAATYLIAKFVG